MKRGINVRISLFACLGLILVGSANLFAQAVAPPPGFVPGSSDEYVPSAPPEPGIVSGQEEYSKPFGYSSSPITSGGSPIVSRGTGSFPYGLRPPEPPVLFSDDGPPLPKLWFKAEALYWWSKGSPLPVPIVTLGSAADTTPGALGQPGTSVLLGNQTLGPPGRGGGRFTFGFSFGADQTWGAELAYFYLANTTMLQGVTSDGSANSAILAFPFYDPTIPGENSSPIAQPGTFAGTAVVSVQSFLQGTELNLLHNLQTSNGLRFDVLGGFRYVNLQENLNFATDSPNVAPNPPAFFRTFDQFNAGNNFYGGQLGFRASYDVNRFFMNATSKLAVGGTFETVSVNGGTFTNYQGGFESAPGAYLSQPTNMGTQSRGQFAFVPELDLNFGVRLRPWASIIVGYSFLYVSSVARPGNQIDRVINSTQSSAISGNFPASLSGLARPDLSIQSTSFWAQGLNFGLEFRF